MTDLVQPAIWMRKFQNLADGATHEQGTSYVFHYGDPSWPMNQRLIAIRWCYMHVLCGPNAQVTCNFGSTGQGGDRNDWEYDLLSCRGRNNARAFEHSRNFGNAPFPIPHVAQAFAPELACNDPEGWTFDVTIVVAFNTYATLGW